MLELETDNEKALRKASVTYDEVGVLLYQAHRDATAASVDAFGFPAPAEETDLSIERSDGVTASLLITANGELIDLMMRAQIIEATPFTPPVRTSRARLNPGEGGLVEAEFDVVGSDGFLAIVFAAPDQDSISYWISDTAFVIGQALDVQAICMTGVRRIAAEGGFA